MPLPHCENSGGKEGGTTLSDGKRLATTLQCVCVVVVGWMYVSNVRREDTVCVKLQGLKQDRTDMMQDHIDTLKHTYTHRPYCYEVAVWNGSCAPRICRISQCLIELEQTVKLVGI